MSQPEQQQQATPAQSYAMQEAVTQAQREGWQLVSAGPNWAVIGRMEPVNHVGLFLLTVLTAGLGLLFWFYAATKGPQWREVYLVADEVGKIFTQERPRK